jgi:hypothetical protein
MYPVPPQHPGKEAAVVQLIARNAPVGSLFAVDARRDELPDQAPSLSRTQLLERIMDLNTTASEEYLDSFSEGSLSRYLAHLELAGSPRGGRWERTAETPAIVVRETAF